MGKKDDNPNALTNLLRELKSGIKLHELFESVQYWEEEKKRSGIGHSWTITLYDGLLAFY